MELARVLHRLTVATDLEEIGLEAGEGQFAIEHVQRLRAGVFDGEGGLDTRFSAEVRRVLRQRRHDVARTGRRGQGRNRESHQHPKQQTTRQFQHEGFLLSSGATTRGPSWRETEVLASRDHSLSVRASSAV